ARRVAAGFVADPDPDRRRRHRRGGPGHRAATGGLARTGGHEPRRRTPDAGAAGREDAGMKCIEWSALDQDGRDAALCRPPSLRGDELRRSVARVIEQVRADGDSTLRALTRKFDGVELGDLRVSEAEFVAAETAIDATARAAIDEAHARIRAFHA